MKKILYFSLFFIILPLAVFAFFSIYYLNNINNPFDSYNKEQKLFTINKGDSVYLIGKKLQDEGLIKDKNVFYFYVVLKGVKNNIKAGKYFLSPSMNLKLIVKKFVDGDTAKFKVTIPEGFTVSQIEQKMGLDLPESLEGFLFPDTYDFPIDVDSETVVRIMTENFNRKINKDLKDEIERQGKSLNEIVIMASLLEKEVKTFEDKKIVSGILWKRLKADMLLQVDATINYITGKNTTKITLDDLKIDSPYNTYKNKGLPPGPICNPGLESIIAAVYPEQTDYWYYLSKPNGETVFSKTFLEHIRAKEKYLK